jgi:hypothetical protein
MAQMFFGILITSSYQKKGLERVRHKPLQVALGYYANILAVFFNQESPHLPLDHRISRFA